MGEFLYSFNEGSKEMRALLGRKGANLSEMTKMGLPVPFGFVVTTEACKKYFDDGSRLNQQICSEIKTKIGELEEVTGKKFGSGDNPLLVSVRTSSVVNIPTMASTVLNLGLNDQTVEGLIKWGGMEFGLDSYTRFLRTYGVTVRRIPSMYFISAYENIEQRHMKNGGEYSEADVLLEACNEYKKIIIQRSGRAIPTDPFEQLLETISAKLSYWNSYSSRNYRELHEIPENIGVAAVVQAMVFGNLDWNSCSGTVFTRDPNSGEKIGWGEFLVKAQGGGVSFKDAAAVKIARLEDFFPGLYSQFVRMAELLENYNQNMQEIEFVVEGGKLYMLETKAARRTPEAAVKIAVDMVDEGLVDRQTAVANIRAQDVNKLVLSQFEEPGLFGEEIRGNFNTVLEWTDDIRTVGIRANIDTPKDAELALKLGAEGVGLCRTEHMFFEEERLHDFMRMVLAENDTELEASLEKLKEYQKDDFKQIFMIMEDRPVTIRLLDPSLHKFFPSGEKELKNLSKQLHISENRLMAKIMLLKEENPTMGKRGGRLAVTRPEIAGMQTEAVIEAALEVNQETGIEPNISIMVPFISSVREFTNVKETINKAAAKTMEAMGGEIEYAVGTMIETPRAALVAGLLAEHADFLSFGTNDLTELVYGFSKTDTEELIEDYIKKDILDKNPMYSLDERGVGLLIDTAVSQSRKSKPNIKIGLCGEHGCDPDTIAFCKNIGINYFSCSTLRIPGARLAAAQAEIKTAKL